MNSLQRNTQSDALTELRPIDAPLRVLVSEPDITSRRLICTLLQSSAETTVTCVEDSQLLSAIDEAAPDIVIVDVHSPSIRRAYSWEALGIQPAPETIATGFDPSALSTFASTARTIWTNHSDCQPADNDLRFWTGDRRFSAGD